MEHFEEFAQGIWLCAGDTVSFNGMPFTTRMTIIRLNNNDLWIHSPVSPTDEVLAEMRLLGVPRYIVSPNKLHHLYLKQWRDLFPRAMLYAPPGLTEKRPDIDFDARLPADSNCSWEREIGHAVFRGSPVMKEAVFFHYATKTLILGDLIENFPEDHFSGLRKVAAKITGIVSPHGKTPLDWRLTFILGKKSARESLSKMVAWEPENIILAHGECIKGRGTEALRKSFSWLE